MKGAENMDKNGFKQPSVYNKPVPFWSWNDKIENDELVRRIDEMADKGWGGFFMHTRVGLVTEYLSEDWFEKINLCAKTAGEKNILAWLYDEDKWPSGFAGGEVAENEEYRDRALVLLRKNQIEDNDTVFTDYTYGGIKYYIAKRVSKTGKRQFNGTSYVDLLKKTDGSVIFITPVPDRIDGAKDDDIIPDGASVVNSINEAIECLPRDITVTDRLSGKNAKKIMCSSKISGTDKIVLTVNNEETRDVNVRISVPETRQPFVLDMMSGETYTCPYEISDGCVIIDAKMYAKGSAGFLFTDEKPNAQPCRFLETGVLFGEPFEIKEKIKDFDVSLTDLNVMSVNDASLCIDGKCVTEDAPISLGWQAFLIDLNGISGKHRLTVELADTLFNLMGPNRVDNVLKMRNISPLTFVNTDLFTEKYSFTDFGFSVSADADKSALQYIYDANIYKESSEFSEKSFEVFMEAMTAAETILNDTDASQEDVDEAVRALTDAVNGLNYYKRTDRTVTKDTWVTSNSGNGGKNFGSDAALNGKLPYDNTSSTARQIFLGFDISGIDPEVSTVTLRTYMVKNGSNGTYADTEILLYGSSDTSWDESKITWNNRPNKSTMTAVGSLKPGDVVIEENDSNHRWIEFDVTDYVKQLFNDGAEEASFMIGTHNVGSAWIAITSKEDSRGNAAQLVFESGLDKTIGGMMDEDLNDINIEDYLEDIAPDRISQSLKALPGTGKNGYTITWKSSNPDIMSDAGEIVKLPDAASPVTMTASIERDGITHKKDFELVVLEDRSSWSDMDYIEKDLNDLEFSDFCTQDADKVVSSINLPEYLHADDGVTFTWDVTNKDAANGADFNDVDKNEWYYPYICTAVNQSIVTGMDNGNFGIGLPITRQDMAVMAKRALDKAGKAGGSTDISKYGDRDEIADYAKDAAGSLTALGVMNGSDGGMFKPYNNATRAEAAKIISVLYGIFNS